jgi:hypothetical protein
MAKGLSFPGPTTQELAQVLAELQAGLWAVRKWDRGYSAGNPYDEYRFEVFETPAKFTSSQPEDELNRMLSIALEQLNGIHTNPTHVGITYWNLAQSYTHIRNMGSSKNINLKAGRELQVEFLVVNNAMQTFNQAAKNLSHSFATIGQAMQGLSMNVIPMPHEKLKDLGVGIEPIVGYRDFYVTLVNGAMVLTSRNGAVWNPIEKHRALCTPQGQTAQLLDLRHDSPNEFCNCGIYAFDAPDHHDMKMSNAVWGEVNLWGNVLICDSGYRAQFAYPKTLFVVNNGTETIHWVVEKLTELYMIPVYLVDKREGQLPSDIIGGLIGDFMKGGDI